MSRDGAGFRRRKSSCADGRPFLGMWLRAWPSRRSLWRSAACKRYSTGSGYPFHRTHAGHPLLFRVSSPARRAGGSTIYQGKFEARATDEHLPAEFHRLICENLIPDWAGRWRSIAVRVGNWEPPSPHRVPALMRDFGADLVARWPEASSKIGDLTLEFLAFAEGRFLTIHPFTDFNGRTIRLFLLELLRRLDLPQVVLAPENETERQIDFRALEAADRSDWQPLAAIWQSRLVSSPP